MGATRLIAIIGIFHRANCSRMVTCLSRDGVEPALTLRISEEMIGNPGHQPIPALCTALEVKFRLAGQGFDGTQDNGDVVRPRLRQAVAVNSPKPVEPSKQRLPNQYSAKPHRLVGPERRAAKMPSIWVLRPKGAMYYHTAPRCFSTGRKRDIESV